jgi:hypothetical protein
MPMTHIVCETCGREIALDDAFTHAGRRLCEDCYMDVMAPNRTCDPWAVYAAAKTREQAGLGDLEGLTSLQQAIYAFVKFRGKATADQIMTKFSLSLRDFQNQLATLRHCELLRGSKEDDTIYIVPFQDS